MQRLYPRIFRGYGHVARAIHAPALLSLLTPRIESVSALVPAGTFTIMGSGFGASQGAVNLGVVAQTILTWSNTQITGTVLQSNLKYFFNHNLMVTTSAGLVSPAFAIVLDLPEDHLAVNLTSIESNPNYRITALPDLEIGDQLEARNVVGGSMGNVTLVSDATFVVMDSDIISFEVRAWDHDDESWGPYAPQTVDDHARISSGFFTATMTGFASNFDVTVNWRKVGTLVTLFVDSSITGTSNINTLAMTGLPTDVQPNNQKLLATTVSDNGALQLGAAQVTGTTVNFRMGTPLSTTGFTSSGLKGLGAFWSLTYDVS